MMEHIDIAIVGGGQAGLAAAYAARRAGLAPVVLEAGHQPVGSWPRYYDSLTLFSPARYSELPGRAFDGDRDRYPTRDELVDYLREYARQLDADIRTGQRVVQIAQAEDVFIVTTGTGLKLTADLVIAATGGFGAPHRPALPGLDSFTGETIHSAEYRNCARYAGRRVVVVGGGNSAVQIAAELADVARVSIATRSPLKLIPQRPLGRDLHWWLTRTGLDTAPIGPRVLGGGTVVLDDGRYRAALANGNPDARPLFARVDGPDVVWADGAHEPIDAVILATGFRPELRYLQATRALDGDGRPLHRRGVSATVAGLGYVGMEYQRSFSSATVRGVGRDAQHVVDRLIAQRQSSREPARRFASRSVRGVADFPRILREWAAAQRPHAASSSSTASTTASSR